MPHDVFVFKEEIHILTSSWFTKVNVKDVNILLVIYALNTFLFSVFILLANFGPIPTKNSLKRLQISWGSVIALESTIILSRIFRWLLDLHIISDMVFQIAYIFLLFFSKTSL